LATKSKDGLWFAVAASSMVGGHHKYPKGRRAAGPPPEAFRAGTRRID